MALTKYKLGSLIELCEERNAANGYAVVDVKGISTEKTFIETNANLDGVSLSSYKIVRLHEFAYVSDASRRGDKIAIAFNTQKPILISSIYTVFRVKRTDLLLSEFLFIYFNRPEFDRYARFNSWGSARETFTWEDMCDIELNLPSIEIQQKYVDIYKAMVANQKSYEQGLDDLKLVCDAYIEDLRRKMPCEKIGPYIREIYIKNIDNKYGTECIKGISIKKEFIETKAVTNDLLTTNYKITKTEQFSFNPNTARMGDKFCIAYNNTGENVLVSAIYPVFEVKDRNSLLPEYLMLFFTRNEFDRYVRFHSWGSARETFNYDDLEQVQIPIPDINIQQDIVNIYKSYLKRKTINEKLKEQIKNICPILIKGAMEEGQKEA